MHRTCTSLPRPHLALLYESQRYGAALLALHFFANVLQEAFRQHNPHELLLGEALLIT